MSTTETNEQTEIKNAIGRAVRANYSPTFTNNELKAMSDTLYYILEFIKNVESKDSKVPGAYMLGYVGEVAKKNLNKLRASWSNISNDSLLMKSVQYPVVKLTKDVTLELTKARRKTTAAIKKAKLVAEVANAI